MKKIYSVLVMFLVIAITAAAQNVKKHIYPIYAEQLTDTTAVETPDTYAIVETKNVGRANGGNFTITIERNNEILRTIHSASLDTRFVKGIGYAALQTDNFTLFELQNRNGKWYMNQKTRNRHGRGTPLLNGVYY